MPQDLMNEALRGTSQISWRPYGQNQVFTTIERETDRQIQKTKRA